MPTLDTLRPAPPGSFDRAAALLRAPRPPRPGGAGRRALVVAAALAVGVGACSYPVESERTAGYVVEWTTYGSVSPANYTVKALDRWVPAAQRLAVETYATDRPALPSDHDWPANGSWTRLRYAVSADDADAVGVWVDSLRTIIGAYEVRVMPLVETERQPLGAMAAGRIGLALSPADPAVSDAELQAYVDRSNLDGERSRIDRLPDGRRILNHGDQAAVLLGPGSRLWITRDEAGQQQLSVHGSGPDGVFLRHDGRWRPFEEVIHARLDSVARTGSTDPAFP